MAKARIVKKEPGFNPVKIEITFQSQRELDMFGTLFNYHPISAALELAGTPIHEEIYNVVEAAGGDIHRIKDISVEIKRRIKSY